MRRCLNCGSDAGMWLYCSSACKIAHAAAIRAEHEARATGTQRYDNPLTRSQRYGAPAKTGTQRYTVCPQCDRPHRRRGTYCSSACKQAAYRRRRDPLVGSSARRRERAANATRTRLRTTKTIVCAHCGEERTFDVASSTNRIYCSDACKHAAYRERKATKCLSN